jgi:hypothetical protein
MRFRVDGTDRETGEPVTVTVDAESAEVADRKVQDMGLVVRDVVQDLAVVRRVEVERSVAPAPPPAPTLRTTPTRSNSFGIASLVLAIVAFVFCWIPFVSIVSLPIAGIAFVLGLIGIVIASGRGGYGLGFPIAGILLSLLALPVALFLGLGLFLATAEIGDVGASSSAARNTPATISLPHRIEFDQCALTVDRVFLRRLRSEDAVIFATTVENTTEHTVLQDVSVFVSVTDNWDNDYGIVFLLFDGEPHDDRTVRPGETYSCWDAREVSLEGFSFIDATVKVTSKGRQIDRAAFRISTSDIEDER